jgi:hypothetical protein
VRAQTAEDDAVGWGEAERSDDPRGPEAQQSRDDAVGWGQVPDVDASGDTGGSGSAQPGEGDAQSSADEPSPITAGGRYRLRGALFSERLRDHPFAQARSLLGLWLACALDFDLAG